MSETHEIHESQESEQLGLVVPTEEQRRNQELTVLAINLRNARSAEESAKTRRIELENIIAGLLPGKEIGQETTILLNGTKIVIKRGMSYTADLQGVEDALKLRPGNFMAPIRTKTTRKLDEKGYEWYRRNHPGIFAYISQHVTVTPRKASVTLVEIGS